MSHPSRSVLALSAGAALAACPLAAAVVPGLLNFSSLVSANGSITLGSTTGSLSVSGGPYPFGYDSLTVTAGYGSGVGYAWHVPGPSLDVFIGRLITVGYYSSGNWTFTVVMNVNQAVRFSDLSFAGLRVATWLMDSAAISDGDLVSIGQHTFTGTASYTGAAITQMASGFGFYAAAAAVPLPGAAGLAAIGLVGMSRRRRR